MTEKLPDITQYSKKELVELLKTRPVVDWNDAFRVAARNNPKWGPDLSDSDLSDLDLGSIYLRNAKLQNADFTKTNLKNADLRNSNLDSSKLIMTDLRDANLSNAKLRVVNLNKADLCEANCMNADFTDACFTGTNLQRTCFTDATLIRTLFTDAQLDLAEFQLANLNNSDFEWSSMRGTEFREADLQRVKFKDVRFKHTLFSGSSLGEGITLSGDYAHLGIIQDYPLLVFSIEENPGYIIQHNRWTGALSDFPNYAQENEIDQSQIDPLMGMVEATVMEWPDIMINNPEPPDLHTKDISDSTSSYLNAESKRTGISPADIILDD